MSSGISPLIATVILIGLVVVFSVSFIIWGSEFTDFLTGKTEKRAERDLSCAEDIDLDVLDACYECSNNDCSINIKLRNNKDVDLTKQAFNLKLEGKNGVVVNPIYPPNFGPLDIKTISTQYTYSNIGKLNKVVIIPKIKVNDESVFCGPLPEIITINDGC